ncbi:MAG TPA: DUF6438 domain-containing protein [Allosphingosinicella sp.]|nr:DUF6438 domain-containing protein [Allosphingosinicella sp.]
MKAVLALLALLAAFLGAGQAGAQEPPMRVTGHQLMQHRIAGLTHVRVAAPGEEPAEVPLEVLVDEAGRVAAAGPVPQSYALYPGPPPRPWQAEAVAQVRSWRFRPFVRDGRAVPVRGYVHLRVLPPERPPARRVDFPELGSEETTITLRRHGCFGVCATYDVTIRADGRVRFNGIGNVLLHGVREYSIPVERVERLIARFRAADFWSLDPHYQATVTDSPTYELTFAVGRRSKTVTDYVGHLVAMPDAVRVLEDAVDEAADTSRWIHGNESTLDALAASGFDFRSEAAGHLLIESIGVAPDSVALGLIDRGAPLDAAPPACHGCWESSVRESALAAAILHGRPAVFDRLASDSAIRAMADQERDEHLLAAAYVHSGHIVERLLAGGSRIGATRFGADTVLHRALDEPWELAPDADEPALVRLLLARGVDVNARDGIGWTALQQAYDDGAEVVRLLLAAGADVNAGAVGGHPILYLTRDEEVALIALDAGADRTLRDMEGRTLPEIARRYGWSRVLALLDRPAVPAAVTR